MVLGLLSAAVLAPKKNGVGLRSLREDLGSIQGHYLGGLRVSSQAGLFENLSLQPLPLIPKLFENKGSWVLVSCLKGPSPQSLCYLSRSRKVAAAECAKIKALPSSMCPLKPPHV